MLFKDWRSRRQKENYLNASLISEHFYLIQANSKACFPIFDWNIKSVPDLRFIEYRIRGSFGRRGIFCRRNSIYPAIAGSKLFDSQREIVPGDLAFIAEMINTAVSGEW